MLNVIINNSVNSYIFYISLNIFTKSFFFKYKILTFFPKKMYILTVSCYSILFIQVVTSREKVRVTSFIV